MQITNNETIMCPFIVRGTKELPTKLDGEVVHIIQLNAHGQKGFHRVLMSNGKPNIFHISQLRKHNV